MANEWYVITGGPCSGKTTLILELERRGYPVVHESAREHIDELKAKGRTDEEIRGDPASLQHEILLRKLDRERAVPPDQKTFFDRGIPDTVAYHRHLGLKETVALRRALRRCDYRKVFLLSPLPYRKDGARTEDPEEQPKLHQLTLDTYLDSRLPLVLIPVMPPEERLELILRHV